MCTTHMAVGAWFSTAGVDPATDYHVRVQTILALFCVTDLPIPGLPDTGPLQDRLMVWISPCDTHATEIGCSIPARVNRSGVLWMLMTMKPPPMGGYHSDNGLG